jgi:hypothetical protein
LAVWSPTFRSDLYVVKRVLTYKNGRLIADTGGISKAPMKRFHDGEGPYKILEEIQKEIR